MIINAKFITFAMSLVFAVIGLADYMLSVKPWLPIWIASFICLMATVGIGIANDIFLDVDQELDELSNILNKGGL